MSDQLKKGSQVGPYQIIKLIAKGGMGEVYLAYEKMLNRKIALKVISKKIADDPEILKRFEIEGQSLALLNNPYVVTVYSLGESDGTHYISMEFVDGIALDEKIKKQTFTVLEAVPIFLQMLNGLSSLHEQGIIHRDMKPKNIIYKNDNTVKIVDFGIAKMVENNDLNLTQMGVIVGSPRYLSPEVARGGAATFQSDLWGLGVIFYEMLEGKCPFDGKTHLEVLEQIRAKKFGFSRKVKKQVPEYLENFIFSLCERSTKARFKNCEEAKQNLIYFIQNNPEYRQLLSDASQSFPLALSDLGTPPPISKPVTTSDLLKNTKITQEPDSLVKTKMETGTKYYSPNSQDDNETVLHTRGSHRRTSQAQTASHFNNSSTGFQKWSEGPLTPHYNEKTQSNNKTPLLLFLAALLFAFSIFILTKNENQTPTPTEVAVTPPKPIDVPIKPVPKPQIKPVPIQEITDVLAKTPDKSESIPDPEPVKIAPPPKPIQKKPRRPYLVLFSPLNLTSEKEMILNYPQLPRKISSFPYPENTPIFHWDKVKGASSYEVQISNQINFKPAQIYQVSHLKFQWKKAQPGQFYWRVRAKHQSKKGSFSEIESISLLTTPPILNKTYFNEFKTANWKEYKEKKNIFDITWRPVPFAHKYHVMLSETPEFNKIIDTYVRSPKKTLQFKTEKQFYIKVAAMDKLNRKISSYSPSSQVIVKRSLKLDIPKIIAPHNGVSLVSHKSGPVIFSWKSVKYAERNKIEFSKDINFKKIFHKSVAPRNSYVSKYSFPKGTIYWRIRAENGKNHSDWGGINYFIIP